MVQIFKKEMEGESLKYIKYEKYYTYTKCQFSREPGNGESRVAYCWKPLAMPILWNPTRISTISIS